MTSAETLASLRYCPECRQATSQHGSRCAACNADFAWLRDFPAFSEALDRWAGTTDEFPTSAPAPIEEPAPEERLTTMPFRTIGRNRGEGDGHGVKIVLNDARVELTHAHFAWNRAGGCAWLVDAGSAGGTFVNRKRIRACSLRSGDLLQIGPFAWQFSTPRHHPDEAFLLPAQAIPGCRLQLRGVSVPQSRSLGEMLLNTLQPGRAPAAPRRNRLDSIDLDVVPGEFLAIIGPSGGGKSTLVKKIIAADRPGTLFVDGLDAARHVDWYRSMIGYVSQDKTLLDDLTAEEAVEFSGLLRGTTVVRQRIDALLNEADLRFQPRGNPCYRLSGGESKRVHVAAELVGQPRLLILDEPGSGLDPTRERTLMRVLRTISYRGCTVLLVTHGLSLLEIVDRVLIVADGSSRFLGTPEELRRACDILRLDDVNFDDPQLLERLKSTAVVEPLPSIVSHASIGRRRENTFFRQVGLLVRRERTMLATRWGKRVVVPFFVLPGLFAVALALAGLSTELFLFLTVLSTIWMAASLGLLSIVDEWSVVEHEHRLFLRPAAYVAAKFLVLATLACLQILAFLVFLRLLSPLAAKLNLDITLAGMWALFPVGVAAVGLGMLISATARGSRPLATFILPFVMLCQIVFSVYVNSRHGTRPVETAYSELSLHRCERPRGDGPCPLRARRYLKTSGGFECDVEDHGQLITREDAVRIDDDLPTSTAVAASYLTLSRYGDLLIRLTSLEHYDATTHPWGRRCLLALTTAAALFPIATWLVVRTTLARRRF